MTSPSVHSPRPGIGSILLGILGLAVLWILFSGKFDALHLAYGVVSIALVILLSRRIVLAGERQGGESILLHLHPLRFSLYMLWLLKEIVVANLQVAAMILRGPQSIDPVLLKISFPIERDVIRVTLGNSITLTPGTFTLSIEGDEFVVHSISRSLTSGLTEGAMQRKVAKAFGQDVVPPAGGELFDTFDPMRD